MISPLILLVGLHYFPLKLKDMDFERNNFLLLRTLHMSNWRSRPNPTPRLKNVMSLTCTIELILFIFYNCTKEDSSFLTGALELTRHICYLSWTMSVGKLWKPVYHCPFHHANVEYFTSQFGGHPLDLTKAPSWTLRGVFSLQYLERRPGQV